MARTKQSEDFVNACYTIFRSQKEAIDRLAVETDNTASQLVRRAIANMLANQDITIATGQKKAAHE